MLDEAIKSKLRDPAYLDLHLVAARAIREVGLAGWYDSHFLRRLAVARHYLETVRPEAGCEGLVDPLRWADEFAIPELAPLIDLFEREAIVADT